MSPSQASETCASASSATSAKDKIIASRMLRCQLVPQQMKLWSSQSATTSEIPTFRDSFLSQHFQSIPPSLTNSVMIGIAESVAHAQPARNKDAIPIAAEPWSASIQTPIAGVMAVNEDAAFPTLISSPINPLCAKSAIAEYLGPSS